MSGTEELFDQNRRVLKALIAGGAVYQALSQGESPRERDRVAFLEYLEGSADAYHQSRESGAEPRGPAGSPWRFPVVTHWIRTEHAGARALVPVLANALRGTGEVPASMLPALRQYLDQVRWMIHVENDGLAHARPSRAASRPRRAAARLRQLEAA